MPVTLFGRIDRAVVVDLPEIAAILPIAVLVPQVAHAVVDDLARTRATEQMADGEAVNHARRGVDAAGRIGAAERLSLVIEIKEPAGRIDAVKLEEVEQSVRLIDKPFPMIGQGGPWAGSLSGIGHANL